MAGRGSIKSYVHDRGETSPTTQSHGCTSMSCTTAASCKTVNMNLNFAAASNLSHTDDRWSPTCTSHRTSGKQPRCLTAQMCSSAQPQPPTTAWPPEVMVVIHQRFYSFGNKTQQNNCQQFRLLAGLLTLQRVKSHFPYRHGFSCCGQMIPCGPAGLCLRIWHHKRRKWSGLKDISSPAELSEVFASSFRFAAAHFSFQPAAKPVMPVKSVFIY